MCICVCAAGSKWSGKPLQFPKSVALMQEALVKVRVRVRAVLGPRAERSKSYSQPWKIGGPTDPPFLELGSSSNSGPLVSFCSAKTASD